MTFRGKIYWHYFFIEVCSIHLQSVIYIVMHISSCCELKKSHQTFWVSLALTLCNRAAFALEMFESVPAPRGARRESAHNCSHISQKSRDIFTTLLMRAVRECGLCNWVACESTEAPLCLQIWSRYRNEKRERGGRHVSTWEFHTVRRKLEDFITRAIYKTGRGMSRENLRGSTFSLAFVLAFCVILRR